MNNKKIVLIIGAGGTIADVASRPLKSRPPLDKKFFTVAKSGNYKGIQKISSHMEKIYNIDVFNPEYDSLEKVMTVLYTDIYDPSLESKSIEIFRSLIRLFNKRLADTTNDIKANNKRYLYRILVNFLKDGVNPNNITIITFNHDLQIEKILHKLDGIKRWENAGKIFTFPHCYMLDIPRKSISSPTNSKSEILFDVETTKSACIKVLKLHGSLNWYSVHNSSNASPAAMFNPDREILLTRRAIINPTMKFSGQRKQHTYPVIVPPITHKSSIIHHKIKKIWAIAEKSMKEADEVIFFGYSCPAMDFESTNLIQRALKENKDKYISIIDPDSNVLKHYVDLIKPHRIFYYPYANDFLNFNRS